MLKDIWPYIAALIPTAGLLWLFYVVMKSLVEADRKERAAVKEWALQNESTQDEKRP